MILAADFGGTTIKLGLVRQGVIIARRRLDAQAERPMPERLEAVATTWEQLLDEAGATRADCQGTALALPFLTDPKRFSVSGEFGKFPGASEVDYAAWSEGRFGVPTALENDLRVALLGECAAGAARGKSEVVMLAFGTGIGCAAVSGGRLFQGANNRAASLLGHSSVNYQGARGRCGNLGCAEDLASTATLPARAREQPAFAASALAGAEKIDFEMLVHHAAAGDACARELWAGSIQVWAAVLQNAVLAYDPELVVLGGGVLRSADVILPAFQTHLQEHLPALLWSVPIVAAALSDDAALLGAEALFRQTHPAILP